MTTSDYLDSLQNDKDNFATKLSEKGVEVTGNETFTELIPKIDEIQSGGSAAEYFIIKPSANSRPILRDVITKIPTLDMSNIINASYAFQQNINLTEISIINTNNIRDAEYTFSNCPKLETISEFDASNIFNVISILYGSYNIKNVGGFLNLGQSYEIEKASNYNQYTLTLSYCTALTHESLMNIINGLYDIANKGCNTQKLILGSTNMKKLTAEEIAIATNKGWSVS